jgi:soluble lytic murein transglycosylase-like protein
MHRRRLGHLGETSAIQTQVVAEANAHGVPSSIALAVAQQESGFNPNAVGAAGELGTFQLMPQYFPGAADPNKNISSGIAYLAQLFKQFGDWATALAAYNWGPTNVSNALANGQPIPGSVNNYVSSVLSNAQANDATVVEPSDLVASDSSLSQQDSSGLVTYLLIGGLALLVFWAWD